MKLASVREASFTACDAVLFGHAGQRHDQGIDGCEVGGEAGHGRRVVAVQLVSASVPSSSTAGVLRSALLTT
ncbi:hypothetical protein GCM10010435_21770 [Winogradskya consettensis]|uniref:Uncharacterized protein n=1 Tax=Winogradskya consettensis TaxID=113560 RepID=A0A919S8H0_9ACTN|nr:hypothetical protein [Actinoplanes consettensis]GIM66672.1 hypothetical protein Aco04nite_02940 [Actinoplanes consettensis]